MLLAPAVFHPWKCGAFPGCCLKPNFLSGAGFVWFGLQYPGCCLFHPQWQLCLIQIPSHCYQLKLLLPFQILGWFLELTKASLPATFSEYWWAGICQGLSMAMIFNAGLLVMARVCSTTPGKSIPMPVAAG